MTITEDRAFIPVAYVSCNYCGSTITLDFIPFWVEDGSVCAACEADLCDMFFEACWSFVNPITPPPNDEE